MNYVVEWLYTPGKWHALQGGEFRTLDEATEFMLSDGSDLSHLRIRELP